jgi:hypothetical protein
MKGDNTSKKRRETLAGPQLMKEETIDGGINLTCR